MKLYNQIKGMDFDQLSNFLCYIQKNCDSCPVQETCKSGNHGFRDLLDQEEEIYVFTKKVKEE